MSKALTDFEHLLNVDNEEIVDNREIVDNEDTQNSLQYGKLDDRGEFQPLTEDEQIQLSLATFADYRLNRKGVSHDSVSEWLGSIGTDRPI